MIADLIARLEASPAGSRALSDEALLAVGFVRWGDPAHPLTVKWRAPNGTEFAGGNQPDPSRSIDDALKWMVPEGWWWVLNSGLSQHGVATALLGQEGAGMGNQIEARGHSPALAITIASLNALEAG